MRKIFLIIGFSLFLLSGCEEESNNGDIQIGEFPCNYTDSRYYNAEILSLGEMSNHYILIGTNVSLSDNEIRNFIQSTGYFDSDYNFDINSSNIYGYEFKYMTVKLVKSCNCGEIAWVINEVTENPIITFAHYTIQTDDCTNDIWETMGEECVDSYSSLFYVKVKDVNDLSDLNAVVSETNTTILQNNQFMNEWYTLIADKNSSGDALQMANYFYETGLFSSCDPDIIKMVVE
jgi:hypothetical protein